MFNTKFKVGIVWLRRPKAEELLDVHADMLVDIDEALMQLAKEIRGYELDAPDFSMAPDSPITDTQRNEMQVYRQALRDITTSTVFDIVDNRIDMSLFPTPPNLTGE
jgi:hypothetical protein